MTDKTLKNCIWRFRQRSKVAVGSENRCDARSDIFDCMWSRGVSRAEGRRMDATRWIEQMSLAFERVADAIKELAKRMPNSKEIQRFIALTRVSNNWLKMHGYPMRRRG